MFRLGVCTVLTAVTVLAVPALAQNRATTAEITGMLEDSTGGVLPGVTVSAETSVVETTTDTSDVTLDSQAISNLPINGRRFHDFVSLTPTAQVEPQRGQISLAGQRGINGNISIDGADYNQPFFGGIRGGERSQFTFTIPQEAIREFRVVKAGYSPEFGRSTGGLVNAITKSGANDTSGTAFYLLRPEQLAARNAFGQEAAPTQHQFGGSLGGALARNRAFYFVAYEQQEFKAPREVRFARLDVRYNGSTNQALNSDGVGGVIVPTTNRSLETNGTEEDSTQTVVGQFTSVPSSDFLFELRGQYSREDRPRSANALEALVDLSLGEFGTRSFRPTTQYDWRAQAGGNATWLAGGHSIKAGFDYNHVFIDQEFGFYQNGGYLVFGSDVETTLDIIGVGGAVPNRFDSPSLLYVQQIGNLRASFATDEVGLFVQDEWRVSSTLTVNYGLRWDGQFNPTPEADNDILLNQLRGVMFPIGRTVDPTAIPSSGRQFGPRAGFAWDPTGAAKTVLRGFAGIYYARTPLLLIAGPMNNFRVPPGNPHVTLYDQMKLIGIDLNERTLDNLPTLTPDQMTAIATALGIANNPFAGARVTAMDEEFRNPMARQAGGGVQHEISPGWSLGADVLVVDTIHLERNRDLNVPPPTVRPGDPAQRPFFGLRSGTARPVPRRSTPSVRESTASALYRALTISSEVRRPWGQLNAYYVLSKNESSDDNERSASGVSYENGYDLTSEYGPNALDRHACAVGRPVRRAHGHRFERGPGRRRPALQRPRRAVHAQRVPRQAERRRRPAGAETVLARRRSSGARIAGVLQPVQPRQRDAGPGVLHRRQLLRRLPRPGVRTDRTADQPRLRPNPRRGRRVPDGEHPGAALPDAGRLPAAVLVAFLATWGCAPTPGSR